jgi:hypothetical protein
VDVIATGVILVVCGALGGAAAVQLVFYSKFSKKINDIGERMSKIENFGVYGYRFQTPADEIASVPVRDFEGVASLDIAGAWAAEQEQRGVSVTDEEISTQRRMWAEEGTY